MMLTVKQVAGQLSVSATCVYQLIATGRLTSHRIGLGRGAIRICEADLAAFIDECRNEKRQNIPAASHAPDSRGGFKHLRLDD